jgi:mevalonate kinase
MTEQTDTDNYWHARAKLMITGEYLVLRGAKSLAIPLKYGQSLHVTHDKGDPRLEWSAEIPGKFWFSAQYNKKDLNISWTDNAPMANRLREILQTAREMNPEFLTDDNKTTVRTALDFPPEWGIGSSSSLMANIARWAGIDPYEINRKIFRGSGYDIAAALSSKPILYNLVNGFLLFSG